MGAVGPAREVCVGVEPGCAARECFVSVTVETSGPIPGHDSLLALAACLVGRPGEQFYVELKPLGDVPNSEAVTRRDRTEPRVAIGRFRDWLRQAAAGTQAVYAALNAGPGWSFVNWYFHTYFGANPFGSALLDMRSYYMGLSGCSWGAVHDPVSYPSCLDEAVVQAKAVSVLLAVGSGVRGCRMGFAAE